MHGISSYAWQLITNILTNTFSSENLVCFKSDNLYVDVKACFNHLTTCLRNNENPVNIDFESVTVTIYNIVSINAVPPFERIIFGTSALQANKLKYVILQLEQPRFRWK